MRSITAPLAGEQFGSAHLHDLTAVYCFQTRSEIGPLFGRRPGHRQNARNEAFSLRNLHFLSLTQRPFHFAEPVAKVSNRGDPHVMHYSITSMAQIRRSRPPS